MRRPWRSSSPPPWEEELCSPTTTSGRPRRSFWRTQSASCGGCLPHHEGSPLRGLGASLSLDRSKNPCPCFLLRAGPDSGWAVAPRSPPRRPGAQSRRPLSGTLFDLRNHQSLSLDFEEEGGPSSRLHHVH